MNRRLMVPFFILLLLGAMVPFGLMVPLTEASVEPVLIGGNPLVVNQPPDWPAFWARFNRVSDWDLEYFDGSTWASVKSDLQVIRDYANNTVKITLDFTASHAADYRLTFAIDSVVREYVTKLDQYRYELDYGNYSMIWDWSDAVGIPGLVFTHGLLNDIFWFRMRRDNVPLGAHVEIDPTLIASYPTANRDDEYLISDIHPSAGERSAAGQSFQNRAAPTKITSVKFYLQNAAGVGTANGDLIAVLYAHSGVYGTSSLPTGGVLATSDAIAAATITNVYTLYEFTFTGAQQYTMAAGTYYTVFMYRTGTTGVIRLGSDSSAPTATGNSFSYTAGAWVADAGEDAIFYLYGISAPTNDAIASSPIFTRAINGWVNVTVSDVDLVANLATVTMFVNTTTGAQNFTLRWTQATNTFSEVSDVDDVCTLGENSIRVNVDADTDQICFQFALENIEEGLCEVTVTTIDDDGLSDVDVYAALFTYTYWTEIGTLLNDAFNFFGILDYMTQITAYINGMIGYFSQSLTNIVLLVVQQFRFITLVFESLLYWFTGFLTALIEFVEFFQDLLDGVSVWYSDLGALWDWVGWNTWSPVLPYILFFWWLCSVESRSRMTPGGGIQVLINDFNTTANIISYFLGVFSFVANTIIDRVYGLISAIG